MGASGSQQPTLQQTQAAEFENSAASAPYKYSGPGGPNTNLDVLGTTDTQAAATPGTMTINDPNGQSYDPSQMAAAFNSWLSDQSNGQASWQNYANLVAKQGGSEGTQTILGSAMTPYQSILAAQQTSLGNPATFSTVQTAQKKVGAP